MFVTLNVKGRNQPMVINTNKVCCIEFFESEEEVIILFDNCVQERIDLTQKEYITLLRTLSIDNQK